MPKDELPCEPVPAGGAAMTEPASAQQESAARLKVCILISLPFLICFRGRATHSLEPAENTPRCLLIDGGKAVLFNRAPRGTGSACAEPVECVPSQNEWD